MFERFIIPFTSALILLIFFLPVVGIFVTAYEYLSRGTIRDTSETSIFVAIILSFVFAGIVAYLRAVNGPVRAEEDENLA